MKHAYFSGTFDQFMKQVDIQQCIPPACVIQQDQHILVFNKETTEGWHTVSSANNVTIIVLPGARVRIQESGVTPHIRFIVLEGAHVEVLLDKEEPNNVERICWVGTKASIAWYVQIIESSASFTFDLQLAQQGAQAELYGLYSGHLLDEIKITTFQKHFAPHTHSSVIIKGALAGNAECRYNGTIHVAPDAPFAHATQEIKHLLLSQQVRAYSVPSLEVLTNEVHCSHGAASGYLNDDQLNYLQLKGLAQEVAQKMLIEGFFTGIIDTFPLEYRHEVHKNVMAHLASQRKIN